MREGGKLRVAKGREDERRVRKRVTKTNRGIKASSGSERYTEKKWEARGSITESQKKSSTSVDVWQRQKRLTESDRVSSRNRESIITEVEPQGSSMDH